MEKSWRDVLREIDESIVCSECLKMNSPDSNYCIDCGHKLKKITDNRINKNYCQLCGEKVSVDSKYCNEYGHQIIKNREFKICPICGEWMSERYCWNCGHDSYHKSNILIDQYLGVVSRVKRCPNCNTKYPEFFHYCEECGENLD